MKNLLRAFAALLGLSLMTAAVAAEDGWPALSQSGNVVIFRHATAPGIGDPANFKLNECSTQRNLNDKGRAEARQLGDSFRSRKIEVAAVMTSQWCRTRETARLAFGDVVKDEPAFNSTFRASGEITDAQTARARALLAKWRGPGVLVVFSHQVNITALTGVYPASAEGVVLRPAADGTLKVLGTIDPAR